MYRSIFDKLQNAQKMNIKIISQFEIHL